MLFRSAELAFTYDRISIFPKGVGVEMGCVDCGVELAKRRRVRMSARSRSKEAPSIDHIVPLSKGGEHSYANCALAHTGCNSAKSAFGGGQLLLLG